MEPVKRTPLASLHRKLGARTTEFGGYEMPLSYRGIIEEHLAVRRAAGLFDLSHMGEFHLEGPHALALLERTLTNSASRLLDGQAQYTIMCAHDGGTIDDLIVYRLAPEHYLLCVNASNIVADWEWLTGINHDGAMLTNCSDETALVAIQGPRAAAILERITALPVASIGRFRTASGTVAGVASMIARTGYTGEDGFEIFCAAADAERLFEAAMSAGEIDGIQPCGLGARDTLRLEAGLPLYGHELDRTTSPLEGNLKSFVKFGRGFVGEDALAAKRDDGSSRRLIGIRTDDGRSVARQGYKLYVEGREAGVITSGTYAPTFARPLAMAYLAAGVEIGNERVEVGIRNRMVAATLMPLPFYRRQSHVSH
jgi:aminomethyltransferase